MKDRNVDPASLQILHEAARITAHAADRRCMVGACQACHTREAIYAFIRELGFDPGWVPPFTEPPAVDGERPMEPDD